MKLTDCKRYPEGTRVWQKYSNRSGVITCTYKLWRTHNLIWAMVLWDDGYEGPSRISTLTKNPKLHKLPKLPEGWRWKIIESNEGELLKCACSPLPSFFFRPSPEPEPKFDGFYLIPLNKPTEP